MNKLMKIQIIVGFLMAIIALGCANDTSRNASSSTRRNNTAYQNYCDPNFPGGCRSGMMNNYGNNYYGNSGGCGAYAVPTTYGCLPTTNCPPNYGYHQQTNMCYPAMQGNGYQNNGYNQNYYNNGYNQNYYGY